MFGNDFQKKIIRHKTGIILFLLSAAYGLLLFPKLGSLSLSSDEIFSYYAASYSLTDLVHFLADHLSPPFYYLLLSLFLKGMSVFDSPLALSIRLPSALAGVLSVCMFYKVARLWFDERYSFLGALLLASSFLLLTFSVFARFYTLILLLSLLSVYSLERTIRDGKKPWLYVFFTVSCIQIYTHYFCAVLFIGLVIYFFWNALRSHRDIPRSILRPFIGGGVITTACWMPLAYLLFHQSGNLVIQESFSVWVMSRIKTLGSVVLLFSGAKNYQEWIWLGLAIGLFGLYGLACLWRSRRSLAVLTVCLSVPCTVILFLPTASLYSRYFVPFYPLFLLCLLSGMFHLIETTRWRSRVVPSVVLLVFLSLPSLYNGVNLYVFECANVGWLDYRPLATRYRSVLLNRPILVSPEYRNRALLLRTEIDDRTLAFYLDMEISTWDELSEISLFSARRSMEEIKRDPEGTLDDHAIMTVFYRCPGASGALFLRDWKLIDREILVKVWPPGTRKADIIDEVESLGLSCDPENLWDRVYLSLSG